MHVRLASQSQHSRLKRLSARGLALALILATLAAVACGDPPGGTEGPGSLAVELVVSPAAPVAGSDAVVEVRLFDSARRPVRRAILRVEGHMEHPGMAPVIAPAVEREDGVYVSRLTLSMAGGWVFFVVGDLPDGRRIRERAGDIAAAAPPGG